MFVKTLDFIVYWLILPVLVQSANPTVRIGETTLIGQLRYSYKDKPYMAFDGIPYAHPPLNQLRFKEPQPIQLPNGTFKTHTQYNCLQYIPAILNAVIGQEDCLYLYVYVPGVNVDVTKKRDVIIHIHGGGFTLGSPHYSAAPDYLMDSPDFIYVTMNYRLGIFGFLSTESGVVPGNNGLKDQQLAMKWVKDNIHLFGGNSDSVTLTGVSAGAASVHYHFLSKKSRGLFHRGLSQSGTVLQSWALSDAPLVQARKVAQNLTCPQDNLDEMVDCFRKQPAKDLLMGTVNTMVMVKYMPYVPFGPVIEKVDDNSCFINRHPYELLKNGDIYDVPWINSNVEDEGIYPAGFLGLEKMVDKLDKNWFKYGSYAMDFYDTVSKEDEEDILRKIKEEYFEGKPLGTDPKKLIKLFSDRLYLVDSIKAMKLHAQHSVSPIYYYHYNYSNHFYNFIPDEFKGVGHGEDSRMVFKWAVNPGTLTHNDEKIKDILMEMIMTFAKTGEPKLMDIEWKPIEPNKDKFDYLSINSPKKIDIKSTTDFGYVDFWNTLNIRENNKLFD